MMTAGQLIEQPLLAADTGGLESKWEAMDDSLLLQEIANYRDALRALICRLSTRVHAIIRAGITVPRSDLPTEAPQPTSADVDGVDGIEGIDYRLGSIDDVDPSEWQVPPHCIPIHANVTTYNWSALAAAEQFDVIMMDPPWQLATANPTRGVALGYSQLTDKDIQNLPIPSLQKDGFLFIWVINAKYQFTLDLFERWGYDLVDEVVWVKMTVNRRLAKSHGFYLQHAKEVCLVGKKGADPPGMRSGVGSDVIYSERRGQSQKPEEIYQLIEELVPNGRYLEIFGRKNNLRNFWTTVGNEVTGQGPPAEDRDAYDNVGKVPGAVFGRGAGN